MHGTMFITSSAKYSVDHLIDSMKVCVCVCVCACVVVGGKRKKTKFQIIFFGGRVLFVEVIFLMQY